MMTKSRRADWTDALLIVCHFQQWNVTEIHINCRIFNFLYPRFMCVKSAVMILHQYVWTYEFFSDYLLFSEQFYSIFVSVICEYIYIHFLLLHFTVFLILTKRGRTKNNSDENISNSYQYSANIVSNPFNLEICRRVSRNAISWKVR